MIYDSFKSKSQRNARFECRDAAASRGPTLRRETSKPIAAIWSDVTRHSAFSARQSRRCVYVAYYVRHAEILMIVRVNCSVFKNAANARLSEPANAEQK